MTAWNWAFIAAIVATGAAIVWFGVAAGRKHPDVEPENFGKVKFADIIWPIITFVVAAAILIGAYTQADFSGVKWPSLFGQKESDSTVSGNSIETVSGNSVSENTADTAVKAGVDTAEVTYEELLAEVPENSVFKINPGEAEKLLGVYLQDIPLHHDWDEANWIKEEIAKEFYGGEAEDLLGYPTWCSLDGWLLLDQAIGCRKVEASELKNVDLSNHDAVWQVVKPKLHKEKEAFDALSAEEQAKHVNEMVLYAIINSSSTSEAYYLAFMDCEWYYRAARDVLDDIDRRYQKAYSLVDKDREEDAVGRECWMEYSEEEPFDPEHPEYSGHYTKSFFNNISAQVAMLYLNFGSPRDIGKYTTDKHWCYPKSIGTALRHVVPAAYTEKSQEFLRKYPKEKYDVIVDILLVNLGDGRPGWQTVTNQEIKRTYTKAVQYNLDIGYFYEDGVTPVSEFKPHHSVHNAGDSYRVESPQLQGYTCDTPVVEGVMPAKDQYFKVLYYKKQTSSTNTSEETTTTDTTGTTDEGGNPPGDEETPPENEDKKFPKDAGEEVVRNGTDAQTNGGKNSDLGDGSDKNIEQTIQNNESNRQEYTGDSSSSTSSSSTTTDTSSTTSTTDTSSNDTVYENNNNAPVETDQSGTGTEETVTNNGDGTSTVTQTPVDTSTEISEGTVTLSD